MTKVLIYLPYTWPTISTRFFKSFLELTRHEIPGVETDIFISKTFPLDRSRNEVPHLAMSTKFNATHILMVDGDNLLPRDALEKLLEHCSDEYPVVSGLYWRKSPPYRPVPGNYSGWAKHEGIRKTLEAMDFVDKDGNQLAFYNPVTDFDTIQRIDVSGCGCLLIRCDVFERIEQPYFAYHNSFSLGGDYSISHMSEDINFFCKLRKAGIKTLLIPTIRAGHEVLRVIGSPEQEEVNESERRRREARKDGIEAV